MQPLSTIYCWLLRLTAWLSLTVLVAAKKSPAERAKPVVKVSSARMDFIYGMKWIYRLLIFALFGYAFFMLFQAFTLYYSGRTAG